MDQRQTFGTHEELKAFLTNLQKEGTTAGLLVDHEGLSRASGKITAISNGSTIADDMIQINGESTFRLGDIVAVNGIFRSDYSEC
jgi:hypothetical protein